MVVHSWNRPHSRWNLGLYNFVNWFRCLPIWRHHKWSGFISIHDVFVKPIIIVLTETITIYTVPGCNSAADSYVLFLLQLTNHRILLYLRKCDPFPRWIFTGRVTPLNISRTLITIGYTLPVLAVQAFYETYTKFIRCWVFHASWPPLLRAQRRRHRPGCWFFIVFHQVFYCVQFLNIFQVDISSVALPSAKYLPCRSASIWWLTVFRWLLKKVELKIAASWSQNNQSEFHHAIKLLHLCFIFKLFHIKPIMAFIHYQLVVSLQPI